jgi:hypothetical protein
VTLGPLPRQRRFASATQMAARERDRSGFSTASAPPGQVSYFPPRLKQMSFPTCGAVVTLLCLNLDELSRWVRVPSVCRNSFIAC